MTTESPMRMKESGGARNWPSSKDSVIYSSGLNTMAAEELGLLLKGQSCRGDQADMIPSRSGSAPPSVKGSFATIGNFLAAQNSSMNSSLQNLSTLLGTYESDKQLRSHPSYLAYYCSNVNLNPRLPLPLISRENQRFVHHMASSGNHWRSSSVEDIGYGTVYLSRNSLSTHEEEPEEDRSLGETSENLSDIGSAVFPGQKSSLVGCHKSFVDLIQEDFPRTPSPVYNLSRASTHGTAEEPIDLDIDAISLDVSTMNMSQGPNSNGSADDCVDTCVMGPNGIALVPNNDPSAASISSSPCPDITATSLNRQLNDENCVKGGSENYASVSAAPQSDISQAESRMRKKQEEQQFQGINILHQFPSAQQGFPYQIQGAQAQSVSLGMTIEQNGTDKNSYDHAKLSCFEMQPPLHPPGVTPPFCATAAALIPCYPSFLPSGPGVYPPQYNVGGYALNSAVFTPFVAGYPSHGPVPLPFLATSDSPFNIRTTSASTREGIPPHVSSPQHQKFFRQPGLMLQPPFVDPHHLQYFQHPFGDGFGTVVQHARLASSGFNGAWVDPSSKQERLVPAYMGDPNVKSLFNGGISISNPSEAGMTNGGYYGALPGMGVMEQFPSSPIASPVLPSMPFCSTSPLGRRHEMRISQGLNRNAGIFSGWQGQGTFDDCKKHSFLEELKSKALQFELSDIAGRIVEFSVDQHGSRFIQQKLEHCSIEEKISVFQEVLPHASELMTDVFGNYVIQKFFEHGSPEQRKDLAEEFVGQMLPLEFADVWLSCDTEKVYSMIPAEKIGFIISAFKGQVATLSIHPYDCRVIQHVLERGKPRERSLIFSMLTGNIVQMSQHKYASNVVEKCLEYGDLAEREHLIEEMLRQPEANDCLLVMMKDQYANYVIQKILDKCNEKQQESLISRIRVHYASLRKYTYGKHIVARFEKLYGEESQPAEASEK